MNEINLNKNEEDVYLHIAGVVTITKTSNLTVKEFEEKFLKFVEDNKCYFNGGTYKVD